MSKPVTSAGAVDTTAIREALATVRQIQVLTQDAEARLMQILDDADPSPGMPRLSMRERQRVERVGESASEHLAVIERNGTGSMTLGESLEIRRRLYGDRVRGSGSLFGKKGEHAILHRQTPFGQRRRDSDPIVLTEDGERIARLWRQMHPEAAHARG